MAKIVQCCLAVLIVGAFAHNVRAAVITIKGEITAVDATKRTITVRTKAKTLELDVSRKAKVRVKGKKVKLDILKPGQKVKLSYHDELEIVLKIEAASNSPINKPKLIELSEINAGNYTTDPWLSQDGLTIYWATEDSWIWTASRENSGSFFEKKKRLVKGGYPTVSSDGLEMIFVSARGDGQSGRSFFVTTRRSVTSSFLRPKEIDASLQLKFPANPCVSADGLTLYFSMVDTSKTLRMNSTNQEKQNVWIFGTMARKDNISPWSSPKALPLKRAHVQGKLTWVFPSDDELSILCAREGWSLTHGTLMIWTRDSTDRPFSKHKTIEVNGLPPLVGRSPRYCAKTKELFFVRDLSHDGNRKFALWMVKGVKLDEFISSQ